MLIAARNAVWGGKRGLSAKDYVQDGLIAMWDGIENAGWGKHSDAPPTWKDLTGNHVATPSGNPVYREDCVYLDGDTSRPSDFGDSQTSNSKFSFNSPLIKDAINANEITVEVIFNPIKQTSVAMNGGYLSFCNNVRGVWLWNSSSYAISAFSYRTGDYKSVNLRWSDYSSKKVSVVLRKGDFILNGATIANVDGGGGVVADDSCYIGYLHGLFHGRADFYAVRVYNRALTAEEIAYNYNIDKARFGL